MEVNKIHCNDALNGMKKLPSNSVDVLVTSPPYWGLRDYHIEGQLGLEKTPEEFIQRMADVFDEGRRVMKPTGTCWINIGDSYAHGPADRKDIHVYKSSTLEGGKSTQLQSKKQINKVVGNIKRKDLIGIPWMLAFELRKRGWYLRQDIIWAKPNPIPESITDRCTKAHEYIFLLTKSPKYYYDAEAIKTEVKQEDYHMIPKGWAVGSGSHSAIDHATTEGQERKRKNMHDASKKMGINGTGFKGHSGNYSADGKLIGNGMANKRSVWTVTTQPYSGAHFATFPEKLIVDCIKAGSSEYGCCEKCGAPWERIIDKELVPTAKASYNSKPDERDLEAYKMDQGSNRQKDGHKPGGVNKTETKGWKPTCKCGTDTVVPAIILDPFMGAGTTAVVARKLNRNYVGFELNPKYITLAEKRIIDELGFFV